MRTTTQKVDSVLKWGTFLMSFLAVIAIPIGVLVLRDQRYQIAEDNRKVFMTIESFRDWKGNHDVAGRSDEQRVEKLEMKIDRIGMKIDTLSVTLAAVQAQLKLSDPVTIP
jgi:hypothetical protein